MWNWLLRLFRRADSYKSHLAPLNPRLLSIYLDNMQQRK